MARGHAPKREQKKQKKKKAPKDLGSTPTVPLIATKETEVVGKKRKRREE